MATARNASSSNAKSSSANGGAIQKHLNTTLKAAAIMLPSQILNIGRVSTLHSMYVNRVRVRFRQAVFR